MYYTATPEYPRQDVMGNILSDQTLSDKEAYVKLSALSGFTLITRDNWHVGKVVHMLGRHSNRKVATKRDDTRELVSTDSFAHLPNFEAPQDTFQSSS